MPLSHRDSLLSRLERIIEPPDEAAAQKALARVLERDADGGLAALFAAAPQARALLLGVCGCSPYLTELSQRDPARLAALLAANPARRIDELVAALRALNPNDEAELMRALRRVKQEAALLIALADLGKVFSTLEATRALTRIADATLSAAVSFTLREAMLAGKLELADVRDPERGSGWIFLGMGKQGACELNYSSDIDLVVFFDRSRARPVDRDGDVDLYVKLTKRVVKIMSERTADGYVFRTDLRLRPDPGATPIAIPTEGAFSYYESMGQNWERAAFIKARPVAGDLFAGETFLRELAPFVWRKYFDFAAIADVHSIKRQIHAHKGHGDIAVLGHDVKLGRGGIREIEFFAQTQQLITGGRDPRLRGRATLDMLAQLCACGWIAPAARDDMGEAYLFLRDVEHRVQMIADEQKHTLPESEAGALVIARMMGFSGFDDFSRALRARLETVQRHYARLFESGQELSASGNLVFTGGEDDPGTIETLFDMGFKQPKFVTETIRSWHFGRYAATRSTRARERLTELTPALLDALSRTENADAAFIAFDEFMSRLPAGVQLFSLLTAHPSLLALVAAIMGAAPRLALTLSRRPRLLDALLEPAFYDAVPTQADVAARLSAQFSEARSYEETLDRARIFGQEQQFLIGVRVLTGTLSVAQAGAAYARLAGVLVAGLFDRVGAEFSASDGLVPGGAAAVVALGKLGGLEMTATSDLDLMLLYDAPPGAESQGGARRLAASHYYARFAQRLIAALSAPTAQGLLYEVDFRLRPSGNKGPIAVSLVAFADYQAHEAWTWEHMALTRARVIAASAPQFAQKVGEAIRSALMQPRDAAVLAADVAAMRLRIEKQKGGKNPFETKQVAGGLVDIEFIAQYLMLRHGAAQPDIFSTTTGVALERLARAKLLDAGAAETLTEALALYSGLTQALRLAVEDDFRAADAPRGLVELLLHAADAPDLAHLEARLIETQRQVREIFISCVGPAAS